VSHSVVIVSSVESHDLPLCFAVPFEFRVN